MKVFQRYNPLQIAKYVKILFKGQIYIRDVGEFHFDQGRILLPEQRNRQLLNVMNEINRKVLKLQSD